MQLFKKSLVLSLITMMTLTACNGGGNSNNGNSLGNQPDSNTDTRPAGIKVSSKVLSTTDATHLNPENKIKPSNKVFDNQSDYEKAFKNFTENTPPTVDFSKQRVIMSTLGSQTHGGNGLSLLRSYQDGKNVKVVINKNKLASNCIATTVLTTPTIFVSVDTVEPIEVVTKDMIKTCQENQIDFNVFLKSDGAHVYDQLSNLTAYDKVLQNKQDYLAEIKKFSKQTPDINFESKQVVMATLGVRNNGGSSLSVEQVYDEGDKTKVVILENISGAGCFSTTVMTVPHIFATIDSKKPIEIQRVQNKIDCQ